MTVDETGSDIEQRRQVLACLDAIDSVADLRGDQMLAMTSIALRRVYELFPEADALRLRGSPEQQARVAIHNEIAEVFNACLGDAAKAETAYTERSRRWLLYGER